MKKWVVTIIGAIFFFYSFLQVNIMTPLNEELLKFFAASPSDIAVLSAYYFYANVIFLIPAGLILDRFSIRKIMLYGMILAILGTFIFAFSPSIKIASVGRFLAGITMAFAFITCVKLASLYFPVHKMALANASIITTGMIGGIFAQAPMVKLVAFLGWRKALVAVAIFGMFLTLLLWTVIRDPREPDLNMKLDLKNVYRSLKDVVSRPINWLSGLFMSLLNLPIAILGALFGISYLSQVHNLSPIEAASVVSMLFLGMLTGGPCFGWISDHTGSKKIPMFIGASFCLSIVIGILYLPIVSVILLHVLFFLMGFTSSSQSLGYPMVSENNSPETSGSALSLAAMLVMGVGYGIGLPFVGWLLNTNIQKTTETMTTAYQGAFLTIPLGILISLALLLLIRPNRRNSEEFF